MRACIHLRLHSNAHFCDRDRARTSVPACLIDEGIKERERERETDTERRIRRVYACVRVLLSARVQRKNVSDEWNTVMRHYSLVNTRNITIPCLVSSRSNSLSIVFRIVEGESFPHRCSPVTRYGVTMKHKGKIAVSGVVDYTVS